MKYVLKNLAVFFVSVAALILFSPVFFAGAQGINTAESELFDAPGAPKQYVADDTYSRAKVLEVKESGEEIIDDVLRPYQILEMKILSGPEKGKNITIEHGKLFAIEKNQLAKKNETLVIVKPGATPKDDFYYIVETYRTPRLIIVAIIFALLAILTAGFKGARALLGMAITATIIFKLLIPGLLKGYSPLLIAGATGLLILIVSLYFTHGLRRRVNIAVIATLLTFAIAIVLNIATVYFMRLFGTGSEEAFYLQFGALALDLRGLLVAGILLGVLGVLDDVTTTQAGTVAEIHLADPTLSIKELYSRGMSVGKDHIASLINTLLLAYTGASLPLFLLFLSRPAQPWWLFLNSSFIAEEVARTLVGSAALMLAVPITTALAAWWYSKNAARQTGQN